MNSRSRASHRGHRDPTVWEPETLAPSLALTSDWWNPLARLVPLSEEQFQTRAQHPTPASGGIVPGTPRDGSHCPACGSIIYSRRHRLCGVCARPLPVEALFSETESTRIELLVEIDRERHRQWLARSST